MVVLRDQAGGLTLYSPVVLEEGTREALAGLGEVLRPGAAQVPTRGGDHVVGGLPVPECVEERQKDQILASCY